MSPDTGEPAVLVTSGPARRAGRLAWLLVTAAAVLLYWPGAQAYYHAVLANPFFGSTFVFAWKDAGELAAAFSRLGLSPSLYAGLSIARQVVIGLSSLVIAVLIAARATERGALLIAALLVIGGTVVAVNTAALRELGPGWAFVGTVLNVVSSGSSFTLVYVFPDGRFVSRWFRWFWLLSVVGNAVVTFASGPRLEALLLRWPWLTGVGVLFIALQLVFMAASPIYRYWRDASPIQRQQLKWVLLALMVQPILWPVGAFVIPALFPAAAQSLAGALAYNLARLTLQDFAFLLVPIAIGLAILRYRLYDIDLIIRRTLIYAVLTGLLALAYLGLVVVLQNIFGTLTGQRQSTLITVISTLVIAALFGPLRARVQVVVDQRFFRSKYDAARTVAQFGAAMRDDAAADLAQISEHLVLVVQDTLQPDQVSLWVRSAAAPAAQGEPE